MPTPKRASARWTKLCAIPEAAVNPLQTKHEIATSRMRFQRSAIIAIGIAYNSSRVALSERSRDLASLRVLGFTRTEVSLLLVGELLLVTVLSLPIGMVLGQALGSGIMQLFNNELYRLSYDVSWRTVAWMALTNLAAMLVSAALVVRQLHRVDLVSVLKERE